MPHVRSHSRAARWRYGDLGRALLRRAEKIARIREEFDVRVLRGYDEERDRELEARGYRQRWHGVLRLEVSDQQLLICDYALEQYRGRLAEAFRTLAERNVDPLDADASEAEAFRYWLRRCLTACLDLREDWSVNYQRLARDRTLCRESRLAELVDTSLASFHLLGSWDTLREFVLPIVQRARRRRATRPSRNGARDV